jgi:putative acetyltransferase
LTIRAEQSQDATSIRDLLCAAFSGEQEADLVEHLRREGELLLSLVAEAAGNVVGYVGFSRLWIMHGRQRTPGVSLAPLAVAASYRRRGIGTALVEAGHAQLRSSGESVVFVLGDLSYYGRLDYSARAAAAFDCVYAGQHFQALALADDPPRTGVIAYAAAFQHLQ